MNVYKYVEIPVLEATMKKQKAQISLIIVWYFQLNITELKTIINKQNFELYSIG